MVHKYGCNAVVKHEIGRLSLCLVIGANNALAHLQREPQRTSSTRPHLHSLTNLSYA